MNELLFDSFVVHILDNWNSDWNRKYNTGQNILELFKILVQV